MRDSLSIYKYWLSSPTLSPAERRELESIGSSADEISGRFSSDLTFGTGGLRGRMMLGTNAMNRHTVARATEGFSRYIKEVGCADRGVVVGYDSRNNSKEFARAAASVLAGNGIRVYFFDDLRPTPTLSFALRHLGCTAGINITASHNPSEYNGYKAYWDDGAQLPLDISSRVAEYISKIDIFKDIKYADFDGSIRSGLITVIGEQIDKAYLKALKSQMINLDCIRQAADKLSVVYTPLHGAGYRLVPRALEMVGIKNLHIVPEQAMPDGNFPTTPRPNPEYPEVYEPGIVLANRVGSDLIIATDPDADRVGVMARGCDGSFTAITGNQMASLLIDYIIKAYRANQTMPDEPYAVKTIVTTELMAKICRSGGVELYNVLTGFKYIGETIRKKEAEGRGSFIFGAEESYGYLKGVHTRDKDAAVTSALICEMAAHYKLRRMTLIDALAALYGQYGFSLERTAEIEFEGYSAAGKMTSLMHTLRNERPEKIAGARLIEISDYLSGKITDLTSGRISETGLPRSDVLRWRLENSDVIIIRTSGTEPKVKIYYLLSAGDQVGATDNLKRYMREMDKLIKNSGHAAK